MSLYSDSLTLNLLGVLTSLLVVILSIYKWNFGYWKRRNLPYLEGSIPFGSLQNPLSKKRQFVGDQFQNLYEEGKSRGWKHFGLFLMMRPIYMITDLEYVKNILSKDFNYFVDRGVYYNEEGDPLSAHLFSIGGNKWRNLRRKLTPTFTSGKMRMMFKTIADCGLILDKVMSKKVEEGQVLDIKDTLGNFTTDVIGSCAFGLECQSFESDNSPFRIYGKKIFQGTPLRNLKGTFTNSAPALAKFFNMPQIPGDITSFFMDVVRKTIKYREDNNETRNDFLQLLIDIKSDSDEYKGDGNTLTINEIAAQCFVFFLAGFETSATTMTFALYELARNQEIQEKVRQEVNTVLSKHNGEITYDSINDLKYMGQVIDETLRMYPPVPFITRVAVKDYKVPDTDFILEKGTRVFIPIKGIQLDPENFPNPTRFDPDRFSDENKHNIKHFSHLPFGEGNRICIGARFGIMQSKVGLAVLLRKYRFFVNEKTREPLVMSPRSFISAADGEIWLNVEKLNKS